MNAPLESIPEHLQDYITEQDPSLYTPIDQAVWRYVMRVSKSFFAAHGHPLYIQGLGTTGISTDRIPLISEMDAALRKLGWRAVAINGFIPPAIFLEFQSLRILAIACDIRKLENIGYTPSPDIIHEAAGHVPIVADPEYRKYLEAYGEVARNAIITKADLELYEAVFNLSAIKEDPHSTPEKIMDVQKRFETVANREVKPSEAALLTRMAWWTTEYGLINGSDEPLIYGAGLLSSISESFHCLSPEVRKIPFSLKACINTSYDITRPQPQLFVARSFHELTLALDEFANTMAYRRGGAYGLRLGVEAQNTVTAVLDSGVQLTGVLKDALFTSNGEEAGFVLSGAKQFSFHDVASTEIHPHLLPDDILIPLFGSGVSESPTEEILRKVHGSGLHTRSGLRLQGRFQKTVELGKGGKIHLLEQVKITDGQGRVVYSEPSKLYPLALGTRVISVFGGAADRKRFLLNQKKPGKKVQAHTSNLTPENTSLNFLYRQVRDFRDSGEPNLRYLDTVFNQLDKYFPEDWLLRLELLEIYSEREPDNVITAKLYQALENLSVTVPDRKEMIDRGLELI
ncbi:MAG: aromatic amino acid hydroxylase [Bdellovibrionales bacterium]|nr:aromatic amino acid hydroxylase [Bdellovibrionales bacterium]